MNYPNNLLYTKNHEWISFENQYALIGITDFAQKELGDILHIDIPTLNAKIEKEVVFGMVKGIKTISDLFMPVAGVIVALNPDLEKRPELVNRDPHGSWMIKVLLGSPVQIEFLLTNKEYIDLLGAAYSAPVYPKI